jgi:hypothetical protein
MESGKLRGFGPIPLFPLKNGPSGAGMRQGRHFAPDAKFRKASGEWKVRRPHLVPAADHWRGIVQLTAPVSFDGSPAAAGCASDEIGAGGISRCCNSPTQRKVVIWLGVGQSEHPL